MEIIIPYQNTSSFRERNLRYILSYYLENNIISKVILVEQETESNITPHHKLEHVKLQMDKEYFCRAALINEGAKPLNKKVANAAEHEEMEEVVHDIDKKLGNINTALKILLKDYGDVADSSGYEEGGG